MVGEEVGVCLFGSDSASLQNAMSEPPATKVLSPRHPSRGEKDTSPSGSPSMLKEVLDNCPYLVVVLNGNREIVLCNREFARAVGYERGQDSAEKETSDLLWYVGSAETVVDAGEFCGRPGTNLPIQAAMEGRTETGECRVNCMRNGIYESVEFVVTATPAVIEGQPYVVATFQDISEEVHRRVHERVFFHDILNTASAVQNLAELLLDVADGEAAELAAHIHVAADELVAQISNQRQLCAGENSELVVHPSSLSSLELVRQAVSRYRANPGWENRQIEIARDSLDVTLTSDGTLLERVLDNMLKNALEAAVPGETILIGCRSAGSEQVEFWVRNAAVMPSSVRQHVFRRSASTKGSGRGLGTYSMKLLTERYLGGTVSFDSEEGTGTEFRARIPRSLVATGALPHS